MKIHSPVIVIHDSLLMAQHDHACAVCHVEKAVYQLHDGVFHPCWQCSANGWSLVRKKRRWWQRGK